MSKKTVTDVVHILAGALILSSLALGHWLNPSWYLFTAFIGVNLFQYGFTGFCPMALILKKCGFSCHSDTPEAPHNDH